jgi:phage-related protein
MAVFSYVPDYGLDQQTLPQVKRISFGDGYEERRQTGLRARLRSYALQFTNRDDTEAAGICAFLEARNAVESFTWTDPVDGYSGSFVCRQWNRRADAYNLNTVTAQFEEVVS